MLKQTFLGLALLASPLAAENPYWPQFRGPNGAGVGAGSPPTDIAPDKDVKWKVPVPAGASSPCIVGDRIILTAFDDGKLYTLALDRKSGTELWRKQAYATKIEAFHRTEGSPAASTVATDGTKLVSYFGSCGLVCHDLEGKELWKVAMPVAETNNDFGSGTSPIIHDGTVFLVRDLSKDSALYAFHLATGKPKWKVDRPEFKTGYGSPTIWKHSAGVDLVVPGSLKLTGYDPATGKQKWVVTGLCAVDCTSPVPVGDRLLFAGWSPGDDFKLPSFDEFLKSADTNGDGAVDKAEGAKSFLKDFFDNNDLNKDGKITRDEWESQEKFLASGKNVMVYLKPGGTGDVTNSHVEWKATKGLPYVASPIVYQDQIYLVKDGGMVSAFDMKGKAVYSMERLGSQGYYYASPVAANGHLYMSSTDGGFSVIKAGKDMEVVSKAKFGEGIKATPAIVDGVLYVRTAGHLYAFGK